MHSALAQLESTLCLWQQWACPLKSKPTLQATLSAGRSHCSFLVESDKIFFVVRIESPESRKLAMAQAQEYQLLRQLAPLCPQLIWADDKALVTQYVHGKHWVASNCTATLVEQLQLLHQTQIELSPFNLLDHTDQYWQQFSPTAKHEHCEFYHLQRAHMEKTLAQYPQQCICHNDLHPANILQTDRGFTFIDWEYASYNSPYFDLASLVEFGPLTKSQQRELLRLYWKSDDKQHLFALKDFQRIVRFVEWLWESLINSPQAPALKTRLASQRFDTSQI